MLNKKHNYLGTFIAVFCAAVVILAAGWVVLNRQFLLDQFTVWSFTPSSAVATINDRSGFSEKGTFYFYSSQPAIESSEKFNSSCIRQEANSAILGCYLNKQIYIYDVPGSQLDGVEEVTAAHETLHAVWERMSSNDKNIISEQLEQAFSKINDPKLNERMAYYDRTEPGERVNELHSILGTEYRNLGLDVEKHYAQFFANRETIVALHDKYQAVFDDLRTQSDELSAELISMKTSIDTKTNQYNAEASSISNEAANLKDSADSVDRTSSAQVNAYNAKRQALIDRISSLDQLRISINAETEIYNIKVAQYNKLVVSSNELNKSLDSTLSPAPSL